MRLRNLLTEWRCLSVFLFVLLAAQTSAQGTVEHRLRAIPPYSKPTFALSGLDGETYDLRQRAGRVVLVHFFATWCEPCRDELASLHALVQSQDPALSVLAVNVAEVPGRVRRFLEGNALGFPVLLDSDRTVTRAWAVYALPTTFILDRDLVPRLIVEGDLDWTKDEVIAALRHVSEDVASTTSESFNREEAK